MPQTSAQVSEAPQAGRPGTKVGISCQSINAEFSRQVLFDISLKCEQGEWLCVIGPNGSGKTTLLRCLVGLVRPTAGTVLLGDNNLAELSASERAQLVAMIPQNPLLPYGFKVLDYVLLGRVAHARMGTTYSQGDIKIVMSLLEQLNAVQFANTLISELSGGEQQRVIVARALAQQTNVLLLDEPTSALDIGHQLEVMELVDQLRHEHDIAVISSMHDLTLAGQFADKLALLYGGRIVALGKPAEVLSAETVKKYYGANVEILPDPGVSSQRYSVALTVKRGKPYE